jgi:hypothetical protein
MKIHTKRNIFIFLLQLISFSIFSEDFKLQFIKGDISSKTSAVKNSTGEESVWLSEQAIQYVLNFQDFIATDRETEGLIVAAILSLSPDYITSLSNENKIQLIDNYKKLFNIFNKSGTVQIAINSKISTLNKALPYEEFTPILNEYINKSKTKIEDVNVLKSTIVALKDIGNSDSFLILFDLLADKNFDSYNSEILQTLSSLVDISTDVIIDFIEKNDIEKSKPIYLVLTNKNISSKNSSMIAENILKKSILSSEASLDDLKTVDVELQVNAITILNENKWTRASSLAISFFDLAKKEYSKKIMSEDQFIKVISAMSNIAPLTSTAPLAKYLEEINTNTENNVQYSEQITQTVINTLGIIGDKSAFDSLLAATYLGYPDFILSAARDALANLKW